ncbi:DUF2987 domain-containing protein [Paraferrimonas sp. SM1919]|uniref:DUF2987 domain-containing protein n=1 Tax=Paraferrimonas sp. SM1919 TaxID=2662263 RepID=UPI0013CF8075|nr:DUF2987 domain-containing protein [Paraferrimonas sp. SM1919]
MLATLLLPLISLTTVNATENTIKLGYEGFYSHLNGFKKGNYKNIDLRFNLAGEKQYQCKIQQGKIVTEKSTYPIVLAKDGAILLPFDKQLKTDRAVVELSVNEGDQQSCHLGVSIEASVRRDNDYGAILSELDRVFSDFAGFPMKYFRPKLSGLTLVAQADLKWHASNGEIISLKATQAHHYFLPKALIEQGGQLIGPVDKIRPAM